MSYFGTTINDSATIVGAAAAALANNAFLAAKFDSNGKIAVAGTKGENVIGLFPAEEQEIKAGEDVTVQIKDASGAKLVPNGITIGQAARGEY